MVELSNIESVNATGFKKGDRVKTIKKVGSGNYGVVTEVIPLYETKTFRKIYKVMVKFSEIGERACNPEDLKKV